MFSQKNVIVTIGTYGLVIAFHNGDRIENSFFLDKLEDAPKEELKTIFTKNKSSPIYVLLDTIDQSYKKKVYPSIRKSDLIHIVKRDMLSDGDKESLKNYIILNSKKSSTKQRLGNKKECLFVSSSNSETTNQWLEFLLDMPNRLVGIYMLPVEIFNLFKLFANDIKARSKIQNKKNDLYCLILQNKVSGIRQIVLSSQGIVFTRVVNYNFSQSDSLEKYEQDIYSTFEYLKRLFPDLSISELDIVNIFPSETLESIKQSGNAELNFVNYTPLELATKVGYGKTLSENSDFCDLLISKVFSKEKKILKFIIPKITGLEKFFFLLQASYFLNLFLLVVILFTFTFGIFSQSKVDEEIEIAEYQKFSALQNLGKLKTAAFKGDQNDNAGEEVDIDIEKITDFGKMEEALGFVGSNVMNFYVQMKFLKDFNVKLNGFSYSVTGFDNKSPAPNTNYKVNFSGEILNKSGDIEDLFRAFDGLVAEVKRNLDKNHINYSELPRNIDFNQKYYSFPIDFTISKSE
jgi:hypothetical protein